MFDIESRASQHEGIFESPLAFKEQRFLLAMVAERTNRITVTLVLTVVPPYITWTVRPILNKRVLANVLRNMLEIFGAATFLTNVARYTKS